MTPLEHLHSALAEAAGGPLRTRPTLERPPKAEFGDYSTNLAMLLAPTRGAKPREVAETLQADLRERLGPSLDRVEIAGPGFINLFLSDAWYADALAHILGAGEGYGGGGAATPEKVNVEFVSSNPTGPVHIGHARNAALGDSVARLLAFHGHEVHREFYANDAGSQVKRFAESIQARARGEEPPEGGYVGDYIKDIAAGIAGADTMALEDLGRRAVELMLFNARASLERFHVPNFDTWFSEATLDPRIDHAIEVLRQGGHVYESEGALWLRTSTFGDDKDRVLVRSDGERTYFASDIAYMLDKSERGFERLIITLGADHHGYKGRMAAAFQAFGFEAGKLELLIMQFVHLVGDEGRLGMSKRAGEFITLDELIEEIGADAARWFLLARSHDTTIDLDLDLARKESSENPVYYVQYGHARIARVLERVTAEPSAAPPAGALEPYERELVKKLLAFPGEVADAAERRAPHRIATYALDLARTFTGFYENCKVAGSEHEAFRAGLCVASKRVLARSLDLLGVTAPESM
jgi:arginyl-tRNA synthetase